MNNKKVRQEFIKSDYIPILGGFKELPEVANILPLIKLISRQEKELKMWETT
jgi:hypothetical protein